MNDYTITRAQLAENLYSKIGISYLEAIEIIDDVFNQIILAVALDKKVKIASFGSFNLKEKKERIGRNPKTKEDVIIEARKVISFYSSNLLKEKVNKE